MPDMPYQGAIKIRNTELGNKNTEPLLEKTGGPISIETSFLDKSGLPRPKVDTLFDHPEEQDDIAFTTTEDEQLHDKHKAVIESLFASVDKISNSSLPHSEFL